MTHRQANVLKFLKSTILNTKIKWDRVALKSSGMTSKKKILRKSLLLSSLVLWLLSATKRMRRKIKIWWITNRLLFKVKLTLFRISCSTSLKRTKKRILRSRWNWRISLRYLRLFRMNSMDLSQILVLLLKIMNHLRIQKRNWHHAFSQVLLSNLRNRKKSNKSVL